MYIENFDYYDIFLEFNNFLNNTINLNLPVQLSDEYDEMLHASLDLRLILKYENKTNNFNISIDNKLFVDILYYGLRFNVLVDHPFFKFFYKNYPNYFKEGAVIIDRINWYIDYLNRMQINNGLAILWKDIYVIYHRHHGRLYYDLSI